jgi:hypothetical protein
MTRKRGWGAGGSSGTSLSAHSGQASDGQFMNHLRSPNCGCCTIIQPHRSSAMANSSAAGLISKVSALASSARSVGRHLAIVRSCIAKVIHPSAMGGGAGSGSLIASSCRLVNATPQMRSGHVKSPTWSLHKIAHVGNDVIQVLGSARPRSAGAGPNPVACNPSKVPSQEKTTSPAIDSELSEDPPDWAKGR